MASHASPMPTTITSMARTIANMASSMTDLASRGESMASTIATLATTVGDMAATISSMALSFTPLSPVVSDMASAISKMAITVANIVTNEGTVDARVTTMTSTMAAMANTIVSMSSTTLPTLGNDTLIPSSGTGLQASISEPASIGSPAAASQVVPTAMTLVDPPLLLPNITDAGAAGTIITPPAAVCVTTQPANVCITTTSTFLLPVADPSASTITTSFATSKALDFSTSTASVTPLTTIDLSASKALYETTSSNSNDSPSIASAMLYNLSCTPDTEETCRSEQTTSTSRDHTRPSSSSSSSPFSSTMPPITRPRIITTVSPMTKPSATSTAAPVSTRQDCVVRTTSTTTLNISTSPNPHLTTITTTIPVSTTDQSTANMMTSSPLSALLSRNIQAATDPTNNSTSATMNSHTTATTSTTNTTLSSLNTTTSTSHTTTTNTTTYTSSTISSISAFLLPRAPAASLWFGVRTIKILDLVGRTVLYDIFLWSTPNKPFSEPLDQYIAGLPQDSTANYHKMNHSQRRFNKIETKRITRDPSCASFDISLLWKCIKLLGEGVMDFNDSCWFLPTIHLSPSASMECYISAIKKFRNEVYHGTLEISHSDFLQTAADLRHIFVSALTAAKERYNKTDAELDPNIKKVHDDIDEITQEVLGEDDLITFCGDRLSQDLIHEVNDVLKTQYQNAVNIDPIAFLVGTNLRLHVQKVFTEIKVRVGDRCKEGTVINYLDLLTVAKNGDESNSKPHVLLVEGVAGSGKTTLLTLVTDEWLKSEQDRSIRGLENYDLLLKVQCRDRAITTLKCLLEKHVSSVFLKYRNFVLPLIKKCKVLIIIDGLDEANEDSERLLSDILEEMKDVSGCMFLCTSRPEKLSVFGNRIKSKYNVSYLELLGIPESNREQFVIRYHEEIKRQVEGDHDVEELVLKVRELGSRELFRLPINLVFFTWVYHHNPSAITVTTTQTQLYHITHRLSVEKLLDRLTHHPITKTRDRRTLETCTRSCLKVLYLESLLALKEDKLTLERKAEDAIRDSCISQGIPPLELLSAFFCLKATRTYLGMQEQYSAPHKGMQEYYAALHIVYHSSMADNTGNVRRVLNSTLGTQEINLSMLQNVLQHVAGLLHILKPRVPKAVSIEVVDLLQESGVRRREQWLDLLEDTEAAPAILYRVAYHFMISSDGDEIIVTDGRVGSYVALLPHLPAECSIRVNIVHKPDCLKELLQSLTRHSCMWLFLHNYYRNPRPQVDFDDIFQLLLPRSNMKVFLGQLSAEGISCLPQTLENLGLVLSGEGHCKTLLTALRVACLPNLKHLKIHAPVNLLSLDTLLPLPDIESTQLGEGIDLILSGVGDHNVDKAASMIAVLQPPSGVRAITFPRTSATEPGWRRLVQRLAADGVKVRAGIAVPDTTVTVDQKNELDHLAETIVGCDFWRITEDILWP